MRRLLLLSLTLALTACVDTTGLSSQSSRKPLGNPASAVVVYEFGDLQCPACKAAHPAITKPLVAKYGNQIRFEFKHYPLRSLHRFALDAAEASECAADQGKFWEFLDYDYGHQDALSKDVFSAWAKAVGLADIPLFERCIASGIKRDTVLSDYDEGQKIHVNGTPTYMVNGKPVDSNLETISAAIDALVGGMMQRL